MKKIINDIYNKILEYDTIVIMRHIRPDGDAVGSTQGLREILRNAFPNKTIVINADDSSDYLAFMEKEDKTLSKKAYKDALGIVIDTATEDRISNCNYSLCKEIIKIDHHIDDKPYGDLQWVDDVRGSASEMIAEFCFCLKNKLTMTDTAATYIYEGIVSDTGRFRYSINKGVSLDYAAKLLKYNINFELLYANLYTSTFEDFSTKAKLQQLIKATPNGVLYMYLSKEIQEQYGITNEQASSYISLMEGIKGSYIWLLFIDNPDGESIRVRLRSRYLFIKDLATKYHGGGHDRASGSTVYSQQEIMDLINDADKLLGDFKKKKENKKLI